MNSDEDFYSKGIEISGLSERLEGGALITLFPVDTQYRPRVVPISLLPRQIFIFLGRPTN